MISRRSLAAVFAIAALLSAAACQRVPLLAPAGSSITLTSAATALPVNGTAQIIAQVIEASGQPPHSGTQVTFTTTLGTIEPSTADTDVNGRAIATFKAGNANGTATITALSGGSSVSSANAVRIAVGTAAVARVVLSANPTLVSSNGGASVITASVFDINGNALTSAGVAFSTTAGSLDSSFVNTDQNGVATTTLHTTTTATVTASVGAQGGSTTPPPSTGGTGTGTGTGTTPTPSPSQSSGNASASITINVAGAPTIVITPPTTPPTAGIPAAFTFVITPATTNGAPIRDVVVNWGDGQVQDVGALTGTSVQSHTYRSAGTFVITVTVTDTNGNVVTVSTTVTINPTALAITITPPTTPPSVGLPAAFSIVIGTLPPGDSVRNVHMDWGDGTSQDLGAISGTATVSHAYTTAGNFTVTATLTDTAGNTSSVSTAVTVVATATPTIVITVQSVTPSSGHPATVTFQVQVTAPSGVGIQDALITWGDGSSQDLGGLSGTVTLQHTYTTAGSFTVTLQVKDTLGRTTQGSTSVTIS